MWSNVNSQTGETNCLQMLPQFWGIHSFPPGTNPREMQLTGFICGWFSSWHLVINLQAEAEASVSLSHAVYHYCDSVYTSFWLCLCFQKWCWQLSVFYWPVLQETLVPAGNTRVPLSTLSCRRCQELHPWLFQAVLTCMTMYFFDMYFGGTNLSVYDLSPLPQL